MVVQKDRYDNILKCAAFSLCGNLANIVDDDTNIPLCNHCSSADVSIIPSVSYHEYRDMLLGDVNLIIEQDCGECFILIHEKQTTQGRVRELLFSDGITRRFKPLSCIQYSTQGEVLLLRSEYRRNRRHVYNLAKISHKRLILDGGYYHTGSTDSGLLNAISVKSSALGKFSGVHDPYDDVVYIDLSKNNV